MSSYDKLVIKKLKKMTKVGHKVDHPIDSMLGLEKKTKAKPPLDCLPIPLHVKARLRHQEVSIARAEYAISRSKREATTKVRARRRRGRSSHERHNDTKSSFNLRRATFTYPSYLKP